MSKGSDAVKRWRSNTKKRIIESMGGQCAHCSYNRCDAALELHHLDPTIKEMSLGSIRANPVAWPKIVEELRKCVLLCAICHREVHAGILILDEDIASFDEQYAEYRENKGGVETDQCPVCNAIKPSVYRTCSLACGRKLKGTIEWDKYDLFDLLTRLSYTEIAEHVGCSSAAVWKRVRKLRQENLVP